MRMKRRGRVNQLLMDKKPKHSDFRIIETFVWFPTHLPINKEEWLISRLFKTAVTKWVWFRRAKIIQRFYEYESFEIAVWCNEYWA